MRQHHKSPSTTHPQPPSSLSAKPLLRLAWLMASQSYGSPFTARPLASRLCHLTGARTLTIAYRLSPQHIFPTHLLDVLVAYLSLVSPGPDALHEPVDPSSIILAGESAGASLQLGVLQTLLHLRRQGCSSIRFNNRRVPLAMPAGVVSMSCPGDLTCSLPSFDANRGSDWTGQDAPWLMPQCPADTFWPASPPRGELFCDVSALAHPLLSVAAARD